MAAWTASTLLPKSLIRNAVNQAVNPTRQALSNIVVPASTNNAAPTVRKDNVVPATTHPTDKPSTNTPSFLDGQNQSANPQQDLLSMLQDIIGGQKQDPDLVKAQTVLAQQQAMQVARDNEAARNHDANLAAQGYLQSQLKDASQYTTGSVGNTLTQRYNDRLKVLQSGQDLNWLTMPQSSYSTPKRSGWTGPAMPGTWGL